jgi:UDP-N-acetylglucosamine 2-epimerase
MIEGMEWVETVECWWNMSVSADKEDIPQELEAREVPVEDPSPYGDGTAAKQIIKVLKLHSIEEGTNAW